MKEKESSLTTVTGKQKERVVRDLNPTPQEESLSGLRFQDSAHTDPNNGETQDSSVALSETVEEEGKTRMGGNNDADADNDPDLAQNIFPWTHWNDTVNIKEIEKRLRDQLDAVGETSERRDPERGEARERMGPQSWWHLQYATRTNRDAAERLAEKYAQHEQQRDHKEMKRNSIEVDKDDDTKTPFAWAMDVIKNRDLGQTESLIKWVPAQNKERKRNPPKLVDLCLKILATNANKISSLKSIADDLKHEISKMVSSSKKMNARFIELLVRDSPTEIRVWDTAKLTEDECAKIFSTCDARNLTVLQLDSCGECMSENVLQRILDGPLCRFHKLAAISLKGAFRLSDVGLYTLAKAAHALQSINLSQCTSLTSDGINDLATHFESTLRELYLDNCDSVDAMHILPALKKLKHLKVLSVTGIQTVRDDFVIELVEACGMNMIELVLAKCLGLTDMSLKFVGQNCPKLHAIDVSYLPRLTDSALYHLANGCPLVHKLKLGRNRFSDEAVAAYLEVTGTPLRELSLNNICKVNLNTALSIAKCSRNLVSLDLSWCRRLSDEALGHIVDSCSSLKVLKLFGCEQVTDVFLKGHSNSQLKIIGDIDFITTESTCTSSATVFLV